MDSTYTDKINIYSYNSRGFGEDKKNICNLLAIKDDHTIPIICVQEHFLLRGNSFKEKQCLPDFHVHFKPAVMDSEFGRPKNGMFVAVPIEIKEHVKDVSPDHWRVQAILLEVSNCKILIINTYFPTDPRINDFDTSDLLTTLQAIIDVVDKTSFDNLIWTGDLNADFSRNTKFVSIITQFIDDHNLHRAWDKFPVDYTHSYEVDGKTFTSTIDHVLWDNGLEGKIEEAGVLYLPDNTSDHCPIYCTFPANCLRAQSKVSSPNNVKPSWKNATIEEKSAFNIDLTKNLEQLTQSHDCCTNVHCEDASHLQACDDHLTNVLDCLSGAASNCLPSSSGSKVKCGKKQPIPHWNEDIEPFKDAAMFWHAVWQSAGKPLNTVLHNLMKRTRNVYHFHIRKNKRMNNIMKRNNILNACFADSQMDIFKEIRKMRKCPTSVATTIDGECENIPNHFADIYKELYNSVSDEDEIQGIQKLLKNRIGTSSIAEVLKVTPEIVCQATKQLKACKTDPVLNFSSDCIKAAPMALHEHLANIFQEFLIHSHVSKLLLISTLVPLVKDKLGDICTSKNYRSIALSSLILKIFDWVIILLYGDKLKLDPLQFGYQPKISTNMCTWTAVETIDYFSRNGSNVYVCTLDMSKAFDRVKHSDLFKKLQQRNLPDIFIRLLIYMYRNQEASVRWDNVTSNSFELTNGVKQGAVLSALLYCVYVDELYQQLRKEKYGCWVNGNYHGILGYSDDILLLCPSISALRHVLNTCEKYALSHNLQFSTDVNPKKSKCKCIVFGKKVSLPPNLKLCDKKLPWVDTIKHLGTIVTNDKDPLAKDIMQKRAAFINRNNELLQEFHFAHPKSLVKINSIYNSSYYGCVLWNYASKEVERIDKSWNVSMRKMFRLPYNTHRFFLEPLSESRHAIFSFYSRFLKFTECLMSSSKAILRNLVHLLKNDCRSTPGANLRKIMTLTGKSRINDVRAEDITSLCYFPIPIGEEWKIDIVQEIILSRYGKIEIPDFKNANSREILNYVCIS